MLETFKHTQNASIFGEGLYNCPKSMSTRKKVSFLGLHINSAATAAKPDVNFHVRICLKAELKVAAFSYNRIFAQKIDFSCSIA